MMPPPIMQTDSDMLVFSFTTRIFQTRLQIEKDFEWYKRIPLFTSTDSPEVWRHPRSFKVLIWWVGGRATGQNLIRINVPLWAATGSGWDA